MGQKKKYANSALDRRVQYYPPPKTFNLVVNYAAVNEISESEATTIAVRSFFEKMPAEERERYIRASKNNY